MHFIAVLTGRQTFCGPPDVLDAEGIDATERCAEIERAGVDIRAPVQFVVANSDDPRDSLIALNASRLWRTVYHGRGRVIFARADAGDVL
jgi:hypothetical protein